MKQRIILFGLILVGTVTFAQSPVEKGLNTINRSSAEATIGFLAIMNYRDVKPGSTVRMSPLSI